MGLDHVAYMTSQRRAEWGRRVVFDALRANNRPELWCIDCQCEDTNWGGAGRLHTRGPECPPFRLFGGWWR
jgi:hypothetical protein